MLQKGFGNLIFFVLIAVILIGAGGVWHFINKTNPTNPKQPLKVDSKLTIPKSVNLFLESSLEGNQRLPVIVIKAFVGPNGCYQASDLKTKQEVNGDRLTVNILGYKDLGYTSNLSQACTDMIIESRAKIKLDASWLKENSNKEIVFSLDGQENSYKVSYQQNKFSLNNIDATNVLPEGGTSLEEILH